MEFFGIIMWNILISIRSSKTIFTFHLARNVLFMEFIVKKKKWLSYIPWEEPLFRAKHVIHTQKLKGKGFYPDGTDT